MEFLVLHNFPYDRFDGYFHLILVKNDSYLKTRFSENLDLSKCFVEVSTC